MNTKVIKIDPLNLDIKYISEAADLLRQGGLVIIPTETVYGIAANILNKATMDKLYEIKKRPKNKPFSVLIDAKERVEEFCLDVPLSAYKVIDKFWPGPLTAILKSVHQGKIGLRMPDHEVALKIISQADVPLVCPSANISGNPAPVNFAQALQDLDGKVDLAIDAGPAKLGVESSVVDFTVTPPQILRGGAIKKEDIETAARQKVILLICTGNSCRSVMAQALLEKKLAENKRDDVEVLSAGIMLQDGLGATELTKQVLQKQGIDVSGHVSRAVTKGMIRKSDLILVMENSQEQRILDLAPEAKNRLFLLKEFARIRDTDLNIADPIGKSIEFYEKTSQVIKEAIEKIEGLI